MHRLLAIAFAGTFGVVATIAFAQTAAPQQKAPATQTAAPAPAAAQPAAPAAKSAAPAPAANPQQERMKECNVKAEGKKGDERKAFMSTCLSGKEPAVKMTQQEKMTACNKKAGDMKGDERKKLMSECLKG